MPTTLTKAVAQSIGGTLGFHDDVPALADGQELQSSTLQKGDLAPLTGRPDMALVSQNALYISFLGN
jgi:hypothetical protein